MIHEEKKTDTSKTTTAVLDAPKAKETPAPAKAVHSKVEEQRRRDTEMVKGIFRFPEVQGGMVELIYRGHKGESPKKYTFFDGLEYEIPRGLASHLNNQCCYFQHANITDRNGQPLVDTRFKKIDRMNFSPTSF